MLIEIAAIAQPGEGIACGEIAYLDLALVQFDVQLAHLGQLECDHDHGDDADQQAFELQAASAFGCGLLRLEKVDGAFDAGIRRLQRQIAHKRQHGLNCGGNPAQAFRFAHLQVGDVIGDAVENRGKGVDRCGFVFHELERAIAGFLAHEIDMRRQAGECVPHILPGRDAGSAGVPADDIEKAMGFSLQPCDILQIGAGRQPFIGGAPDLVEIGARRDEHRGEGNNHQYVFQPFQNIWGTLPRPSGLAETHLCRAVCRGEIRGTSHGKPHGQD